MRCARLFGAKRRSLSACVLLPMLMLSAHAWAQSPTPQAQAEPQAEPTDAPVLQVFPPPPPPKAAIERLGEGKLKVAGVVVDQAKQRLEVPAKLNLTRGILEYYAVASEGKLHEAVLEVEVEPSHLHLALILAGYEPSSYSPEDPKTGRSELLKRGSLLKLSLKWTPRGFDQPQWLPASSWLFERARDASPEPMLYVFQGSVFQEGRYFADMERSVIGLIEEDKTVVITVAEAKGNPYRGDGLGFEVHTNLVPPKGTPVTLVINPASYQDKLNLEETIAQLKKIKEDELKRAAEEAALAPPPRPEFIVSHEELPRSSLIYQARP